MLWPDRVNAAVRSLAQARDPYGSVAWAGDPVTQLSRVSLRQPPARLLAMIW